jgi:predicted DsbA family dithiol-disulfide isomerase
MEELYRQRGGDPKAAYQRMKGLMDAEGLPYGQRTHTYNSRLAQELGKWADAQPGGEALHDALYRAYFVDTRNIGDPDVLVAVAESVGLPGAAARRVLEERGGRCGLAEIEPVRRDRRADLRRRRLRRGGRAALRGAGPPAERGRRPIRSP